MKFWQVGKMSCLTSVSPYHTSAASLTASVALLGLPLCRYSHTLPAASSSGRHCDSCTCTFTEGALTYGHAHCTAFGPRAAVSSSVWTHGAPQQYVKGVSAGQGSTANGGMVSGSSER